MCPWVLIYQEELDSTAIVSLAAEQLGAENLKTFTGYFEEGPEYSELRYSRQVSSEISIHNQEILVSAKALLMRLWI